MNWQELETISTVPLTQRISTACGKIEWLVRLMLFLTRDEG